MSITKMNFGDKEEVLISFIEKHPELYDKSNLEYKNIQKKEKLWKELAIKVERSVDDCKARWRTLRDYWARYTKKAITKPANKCKSKIVHRLSFLHGGRHFRNTISSLPKRLSDTSEAGPVKTMTPLSSSTSIDDSEKVDFVYNKDPEDIEFFPSCSMNSTMISFSTEQSQQKERPRENHILEALQDAQIEQTKMWRAFMQDEKEENAMTVFFKGMTKTANTFSPHLQLKTKRLVSEIMFKLEEESLKETKV